MTYWETEMVPNKVKILSSATRIGYHLTDKPEATPTPLSALFVSASLYSYLKLLKVTRPSFLFFWGGGVPSYFEAFWYPHLYFYRKYNT